MESLGLRPAVRSIHTHIYISMVSRSRLNLQLRVFHNRVCVELQPSTYRIVHMRRFQYNYYTPFQYCTHTTYPHVHTRYIQCNPLATCTCMPLYKTTAVSAPAPASTHAPAPYHRRVATCICHPFISYWRQRFQPS